MDNVPAVPQQKRTNGRFAKGCPRPPGAGRPKGQPNRTTRDLAAMIDEALQRAGGAEYLAAQAKENPSAFLALVGKRLPRDITLDAGPTLAALIEASWKGERAEDQARALEGGPS